jgi:serine/threonine-protein kinase
MGEVYKADDLKLDQPIALKFLPSVLGMESAALARFHREASIARQVSHPNVCRVYDIGEVDGLHFITMEFIDGEDLASLLRRIGRLPQDKAIEIARQLCAGLAAAHDAGVLHRDLKPANVMIDSRGRARITDFGIAALARDLRAPDDVAGTPAYMTPEQLQGQGVTTRSDIYALGLVLYEIFTGKRAIDATTILDARLHYARGSHLIPPSKWVADLDPSVERAILRCLEPDPARRPASPIVVAASLPGGDPLQAALAAGETPSPEMVAAAGSRDTMRAAVGAALVAGIVVMTLTAVWLRTQVNLAARMPFDMSPEVLAHKARETIAALGYRTPPADTAYGFTYNTPFLRYDAQSFDPGRRWSRLEAGRPPAILFWYRESSGPMIAGVRGAPEGRPRVRPVNQEDPPLVTPGMKLAQFDLSGRLVSFRAVSTEFGTPADNKAIDWAVMFAAAGLDPHTFTPDRPRWSPPVATDTRAAWTGVYPERPDVSIRIESGSLRGVLAAFETIGPWPPNVPPARGGLAQWPTVFVVGLLISLFVFGALLAWRNIRNGRGDQRGAARLGAVLFGLRLLTWALDTDHSLGPGEFELLWLGLADALLDGFGGYVLYLALEPYIRRRWPKVLIAWNRALSTDLKDPLVGREILVGIALASAAAVFALMAIFAFSGASTSTNLSAMIGIRRVAAFLTDESVGAVLVALLIAFVAFLLREVLRKEWLMGAVMVTLFAVVTPATVYNPWWSRLLQGAAFGVLGVLALTRFGLVTLTTQLLVYRVFRVAPAFLRTSAWYSGVSLFVFAALLTLTIWAAYVAVGGPMRRRAPEWAGV